VRSLEASKKYDTVVMPSLSPAAQGGDEEDASASDKGEDGREAQL
jgi:hypothetical protein